MVELCFIVISIIIFIVFVLQKVFKLFLVVVAPMVFVNEVIPFVSSFCIPHINKKKHVYTVFHFFNFGLHSYYNFTLKPHATGLETPCFQLFCWLMWGNFSLDSLLLICMPIEYLLNIYITRS